MALSEDERLQRRRETIKRYNDRAERKAYMRAWYQANKERHRELGRKWQAENREYSLALGRANYRRDRVKRLEAGRALYHRERLKAKSICKELFNGARRRARERNCEFSLTKEWLLAKLEAGVCEISGLPFERGDGMHHPFSPSVDRINRSGGYTPDNARLVIWAVNNLKGIGDDETMYRVAEAIVSNRARK